jgi:hypothetical protein
VSLALIRTDLNVTYKLDIAESWDQRSEELIQLIVTGKAPYSEKVPSFDASVDETSMKPKHEARSGDNTPARILAHRSLLVRLLVGVRDGAFAYRPLK